MKIVPYADCYKNQVVSLILHIQNEESNLNLSIDEQPELKDIEGIFLKQRGGFWVAIENDTVISTIALLRVSDSEGVLKKFFVEENHRGKKVGLQLYSALMDFCENNQIQKIVLDTPSIATRSHVFYKKAGFIEIRKDQLPFPYEYPDRNSLLFLKEV